ncbi:MAG: FkbM family methyltransferase [Eubacterium sp.]|nr:FkbM family methyltransferase [Eubacterium sp.]
MSMIENVVNKDNYIMGFVNKYSNDKKSVILFGVGASVDLYIKILDKYQIPIECIVDNNSNLYNTSLEGIIIKSPDTLAQYDEAYVIVSAPSHIKAITSQILGINNKIEVIQFDPSLEMIQGVSSTDRNKFIKDNIKEYVKLYDLLSDDRSKYTLEKVVEGAITNSIFCYNDIFNASQYFPDIIMDNLSENEVFVDIGAFTGDSTEEFIKVTNNRFDKVIGFEPKKENIELALAGINDPRVSFYPYGVGEKSETLYLYGNEGTDDFAFITDEKEENATEIEIVSLDEFISERISYIKMDIEGMEISALKGAEKLIRKYHPKLAISVYHKIDDLVTIPKYIMSLNADYKLYLRHYWGSCGTDTILIAI